MDNDSVEEWLNSFGFSEYLENFLNAGYLFLENCKKIDESVLISMGIVLPGHRKTLLCRIIELREIQLVNHQRPELQIYKNIKVDFIRRSFAAKKLNTPKFNTNNFRIFLVRHGQSLANVDKKLYQKITDHAISLSEEGKKQSKEAGEIIVNYLKTIYGSDIPPENYNCKLWTSTYKCARETSEIIQETAGNWIQSTAESIFLGEQQFGLFEGEDWESERLSTLYPNEVEYYQKLCKFKGRFWAKPPLGESRADVCMRVCRIFGNFNRDSKPNSITNMIVVSHGITLRAFIMMWFHHNPEWFEVQSNPKNGSIYLIESPYIEKGYIHKGHEVGQQDLLSGSLKMSI